MLAYSSRRALRPPGPQCHLAEYHCFGALGKILQRFHLKAFATFLACFTIFVAAVISAGARPAGALTDSTSTLPGNNGYQITLYTVQDATSPGNPGSPTWTSSNPKSYPVMLPTVSTNGTLFSNAPCIAVFFAYYGTQAQASVANHLAPQLFYALNRHYQDCTYRPVTAQKPPVAPQATTKILSQVITHVLPNPRPSMDPGFSLVGLGAYLTTGARLIDTMGLTTAFGRVSATAHGTIYVIWGDNSPAQGPTQSLGGPWPNGALHHTYKEAGCVTVTVREIWSVSYSVGSQTGQLNGLSTSGTLNRYCIYATHSVMLR